MGLSFTKKEGKCYLLNDLYFYKTQIINDNISTYRECDLYMNNCFFNNTRLCVSGDENEKEGDCSTLFLGDGA